MDVGNIKGLWSLGLSVDRQHQGLMEYNMFECGLFGWQV